MKAFSAEVGRIDFFLERAHRVVVHQCIVGMCLVPGDFHGFRNQMWDTLKGLKQGLVRPPGPTFANPRLFPNSAKFAGSFLGMTQFIHIIV